MTLLEQTYRMLVAAKLTTTAEAFSRDWIGRHKGWYAYQMHTQRDFSAASAIQCLRSIRLALQRGEALNRSQTATLNAAAAHILQHLNQSHYVAEVC